MAVELGRGAATLGAMSASTATLTRAHTEFSSQRGTFAAGRRLLHALTRAATADRVVLWAGSLLFCLVVMHIALKRVPFLTPLHPLYQLRKRRSTALAAAGKPEHAQLLLVPPAAPASPPAPAPPPAATAAAAPIVAFDSQSGDAAPWAVVTADGAAPATAEAAEDVTPPTLHADL